MKMEKVKLSEPVGHELPPMADVEDNGYQPPAKDGSNVKVIINPKSQRSQLLTPFDAWDGKNITEVLNFL